jgi:hypothetical protein
MISAYAELITNMFFGGNTPEKYVNNFAQPLSRQRPYHHPAHSGGTPMRTILQDHEIIQSYIEQSLKKQDILVANQNLQAQSNFGENQLFSKKDGLIAKFESNEQGPKFILKNGTPYWEMLTQSLAQHSFAITDHIDDNFSMYQIVKIPPAYRLNCTKSVEFWRTWWKYRNRLQGKRFCMDLLVRVRHTWYPVKDLCVSNGMVYIKVLADEIVLHSDDLLFWLEKMTSPTVTRQTVIQEPHHAQSQPNQPSSEQARRASRRYRPM